MNCYLVILSMDDIFVAFEGDNVCYLVLFMSLNRFANDCEYHMIHTGISQDAFGASTLL